MTNLPSNTFLFNYSAKNYNSATYTFLKTPGQLFDKDLKLTRNPGAVGDDYVSFTRDAYKVLSYNSATDNPFNRTSADCSFTFIYKTSGFTANNDRKLISNRRINGQPYQSKYDCHNWLIGGNSVFPESLQFSPSNNPQIVVIRVDSNNVGKREEVDINGNVLQSSSAATMGWDAPSAGIGFFTGGYDYTGSGECFRGNFYWMYCSKETLTDAEVLKVINYNEGKEDDTTICPVGKIFYNGNRII